MLIMLDEKQKKVGVIAASAGKSFRSTALWFIKQKILKLMFKLLTLS